MLDKNNQFIIDDTYIKIKKIIDEARNKVYKTINIEMLECYYCVGNTIVELLDILGSKVSQNQVIKMLSEKLTNEFGKGFDRSNLIRMKQFYFIYKGSATSWHQLSWSHYKLLIKIEDDKKRDFYFNECLKSSWNVKQLERQINSLYCERLLFTNEKYVDDVRNEIKTLIPSDQNQYKNFI